MCQQTQWVWNPPTPNPMLESRRAAFKNIWTSKNRPMIRPTNDCNIVNAFDEELLPKKWARIPICKSHSTQTIQGTVWFIRTARQMVKELQKPPPITSSLSWISFFFFFLFCGGGLVSDNFSNFLKPASDNHTPLTLGFVCQFHLLSKVLFFPFLRQLFLSIISVQWSAMHWMLCRREYFHPLWRPAFHSTFHCERSLRHRLSYADSSFLALPGTKTAQSWGQIKEGSDTAKGRLWRQAFCFTFQCGGLE